MEAVFRLLIAEDEEATARLLKTFLEKAGYQTTSVSNGGAALEAITGPTPPDLVLLDLMMPVMTGMEVLERVKSQGQVDPVVILLTGMDDGQTRVQALSMGADDYVTKPFHPKELLARVKTHLRLKRLRDDQQLRNQQLEELNARIQRGFHQALRTMSEVIETFEDDLGGHCRRVAELARELSTNMGLEAEVVNQIDYAARLMDLGLIGVPREIAKKHEKAMTGGEWQLYRHHPELGAEIVRNVEGLDEAARFIRHHHERYGGGGFPDDLAGEKIPVGSRVIAVATKFDHLMEEARKAGDEHPEQVLFNLLKERRTNLDPKIVEVLRRKVLPARDVPIHERRLSLPELQEGMRLSRDVKTVDGRLLLATGVLLTGPYIAKLINHDRILPIVHDIFVHAPQ